jgi:beta-phosphoglucomutase-like phosphatase (HAD superfamily)
MNITQASKEKQLLFLFDIDGLIAETPHEEAWKQAAVEWEIISPDFNFTPFYAEKVAGEPGETGARNILEQLTDGENPPFFERENIVERERRVELARRFRNPVKQKYLDQRIDRGEFKVFDDIGRMLLLAKLDRIPVGAVSSSENAESILKHISLSSLCERTGVSYPLAGGNADLFSLFDASALGAITHWHGVSIEKMSHYAMAYGKLLQASNIKIGVECTPYAVVFEDAPKGIEAVTKLGFLSVGVSRTSSSGVELASSESLSRVGADLTYTEEQLDAMEYDQLKKDILALVDSCG